MNTDEVTVGQIQSSNNSCKNITIELILFHV